jgi:hypothetical protein
VADFLERLPEPGCPVVLDPMLRSFSGAELLDADGTLLALAKAPWRWIAPAAVERSP